MRSEKGSALLMVSFMLLFLPVAALVIDYVLVFTASRYVHSMAEAASLAGALSAELVVEARADVASGEIEYEYFANIVPEKAMQSAAEVISRYSAGGIMNLIQINEIDYEPIREGEYNTKYAVSIKGTYRTILASVVTGRDLDFAISRFSEARLDLLI